MNIKILKISLILNISILKHLKTTRSVGSLVANSGIFYRPCSLAGLDEVVCDDVVERVPATVDTVLRINNNLFSLFDYVLGLKNTQNFS